MTYGLQVYIDNYWNVIDSTGYVLFAVAFVLRWFELLDLARGCYCYALVMLYVRSLQVFVVSPEIGPKVFMVQLMVSATFQFWIPV